MKTYSRKNSSYLKKAFIGSNFNEMCRLCLSEVDMVLMPIFQNSQMSFQELIQYSVDVLVEEGDGLPPNICEECLAMIEQIYLFKKKCKSSDSKLREHFQLMDSIESKLTDTQFEVTENLAEICGTSQNIHDCDIVDPGGIMESNSPVEEEDEEAAGSVQEEVAGSVQEAADSVQEVSGSVQDVVGSVQVDAAGSVQVDAAGSVQEDASAFAEEQEEEEATCSTFKETPGILENDEEMIIENDLRPKAIEKDVVKPFNEENIVINEVKRYVWKNENTGEKDITVCQVVHYDIRNESEDDDDDENSFVKCYSSAEILQEYSNNLKGPSAESDPEIISVFNSKTGTNFSITNTTNEIEGIEKNEGKIQELYELWSNDDEVGEMVRGEDDEIEEMKNLRSEEQGAFAAEPDRLNLGTEWKLGRTWDGKEQVGRGGEIEAVSAAAAGTVELGGVQKRGTGIEDEGKEGLVVDVSWEDCDNPNVDGCAGVVEVKLEENGVIRTHKVFTTENCIQFVQPRREKNSIQCFLCNEEFKNRKDMKSHLFSTHAEAANNSFCEICLKNFTSTNSLKRHMLVHTGVKPYGCEICGRKFSQSSILKRHRYTHGKKKPFECNFCQKSYTQKMNLLSHLRNHGIKSDSLSHRCKFCQKTFVHPSGLSRHLKQHKGVKFTCDQCKKTFSDSSALARHSKSSHL